MPYGFWQPQKRNLGHLAKNLPEHESSLETTSEGSNKKKGRQTDHPYLTALRFLEAHFWGSHSLSRLTAKYFLKERIKKQPVKRFAYIVS